MARKQPTKPREQEADRIAREIERRLDEALRDSFPASDPVAISITGR